MPTLDWLTRGRDVAAADAVPYRLLERVPELSVGEGSGNLLIQGDNLDALRSLLPYYRGQVKCIYIDPPYNTQSAVSIHYDDNLQHAQWLAMIYPRLVLLRDLLAPDGSIWVSIDDNEGHYLKVVMDEVFGRGNFVDTVIWEKADSPRNSARQLSSDHDYIFGFSRNEDWFPKRLPRTEAANSIYGNPDNDVRGPWLPGDPYANKPYSRGQYTIEGPTGRTFQPPAGRFWRVSEERLRELDADGRVWWGPQGSARPSIKRYLSEVSELVPRTLWRKEDVGSNRSSKNEMRALFPAEVSFDTPKPERVIQRILHIATNPGDLVLDSFLGSGTTAAVAHKMGRRWIGVEMGDHAVSHCAPRLRKVIDGEQGGISAAVGWTGGGGFDFLRLGPSVFDETGAIRPGVAYAPLAAHLWHATFGAAWPGGAVAGPFLGVHDPEGTGGEGLALLYNGVLGDKRPAGGNVLTRATLALIREGAGIRDGAGGFDGPITVYGEATRLGAAALAAARVTFRQTPYEVKAG